MQNYEVSPILHALKKKKLTEKTIRKYIFVVAVLIIPVIHFMVFWVYVNFDSLLLSFKNIRGGEEYFTMVNFKTVFQTIFQRGADLNTAFKNTFIFFVYGVIVFPLGLFWAYFFYKKIKFKSFFRFMFYVPTIVSGVVISNLFKYMIGADGPVGILFKLLSGKSAVPNFLIQAEYALKVVIIYGFWTGFAGSMLLLSGALARIPTEIIESANMDGVGWFREMWQICIPLIWPTLSTIIIIFSTSIFSATGEILLLTNGAGNTSTISFWMFSQIKYQNSFYMPSAFGLLLTLIATPISLFTRKFVSKVYADVEI